MLIPVNQVGFGTEKARKSKGFCPAYEERWEQENAGVCMYLCSEVSKLLHNRNESTKVAGRSSRIFLLPLHDPESFRKLCGIHHILLLPKQKIPISLCNSMVILCLLKIDCYQRHLLEISLYRLSSLHDIIEEFLQTRIIFLKQMVLFHTKSELAL